MMAHVAEIRERFQAKNSPSVNVFTAKPWQSHPNQLEPSSRSPRNSTLKPINQRSSQGSDEEKPDVACVTATSCVATTNIESPVEKKKTVISEISAKQENDEFQVNSGASDEAGGDEKEDLQQAVVSQIKSKFESKPVLNLLKPALFPKPVLSLSNNKSPRESCVLNSEGDTTKSNIGKNENQENVANISNKSNKVLCKRRILIEKLRSPSSPTKPSKPEALRTSRLSTNAIMKEPPPLPQKLPPNTFPTLPKRPPPKPPTEIVRKPLPPPPPDAEEYYDDSMLTGGTVTSCSISDGSGNECNNVPTPPSSSPAETSSDLYNDTSNDIDDESLYEEMEKSDEYQEQYVNKPSDEDKPRKRTIERRSRREQKEKEKREKEKAKLKEKFNWSGEELMLDSGVVKKSVRGTKLDVNVREGEIVKILRMDNNPPGKWLIENEKGKVGFVELTNIHVDPDSIRCAMTGHYQTTVIQSQWEEEELYQDITMYSLKS